MISEELTQALQDLERACVDVFYIPGQTPYDFAREVYATHKAKIKTVLPEFNLWQQNESKSVIRLEDSERNQKLKTLKKLHNFVENHKPLFDGIDENELTVQAQQMTCSLSEFNRKIEDYYLEDTVLKTYSRPDIFTSMSELKSRVCLSMARSHDETWAKLKDKACLKEFDSCKYLHNQLVLICEQDDTLFLQRVKDSQIILQGELGHLAIARLRDIANQAQDFRTKSLALNYIKRSVDKKYFDQSIFEFSEDALQSEIFKLLLHARLNPDNKHVCLATGSLVDIKRKQNPGEFAYFSCGAKKWSWQLNRAWLFACYTLGYHFVLLEQHFPKIEEAINSGDCAELVLGLLDQVRSENAPTSQYYGTDQPTATPQEIMVLMDLKVTATKSDQGNLQLQPIGITDSCTQEDLVSYAKKTILRQRSHSFSGIVKEINEIPKFANDSRSSVFDVPAHARGQLGNITKAGK